jgi:hypothetical protein
MNNQRVSGLNANGFGTTYTGEPPEFIPWSSWSAPRHIIPENTEYSTLKPLIDANDPRTFAPFDRDGHTFNKAFGGQPTGTEFWAYKDTDGSGTEWGFFVEADAEQGGSNAGWYGGKVEAFWVKDVGLVMLNAHDKTGSDCADNENTLCWNEIDTWATHHVWGRDDSATPTAFSTALYRGAGINRTTTDGTDQSTPYIEVYNQLGDPNAERNLDQDGMETGNELSSTLDVTNRFEAQVDGVQVTHTLASDQSDQVTELWATLPINLPWGRDWENSQSDDPDTSIEYWDGSAWQSVTTTLESTIALRIGRDYNDGQGRRYAYVDFTNAESVKLSPQIWEQRYQGYARVRPVHIDLHGNPGTAQTLPAEKSVTYTVQTTDPVDGTPPPPEGAQDIALQQGWNLVSTTVTPDDPSMEVLFNGISTDVEVVRDESGAAYNPSDGTNDIGRWDTNEAYAVFNSAAATLSLQGVDIDPASTSLSLQKGWNWVPYLPKSAMPVSEALSSIQDHLVIAKDEDGRLYFPALGIDNLGQMNPGRGYKIYVDQDASLTYPSGN